MSSLATLLEVTDALGITGATFGDQDVFLQRQLDVGSEVIRAYTGRYIEAATYTETWARPGVVALTAGPVADLAAITGATHEGGTITPATGLAIETDTNRVWQVLSSRRLDFTGLHNLEIVYTAGYATIPATVQECLFVGIAERYNAWAASRGLMLSATMQRAQFPDGGSVSMVSAQELRHPLAGFPLSLLDAFVDLSGGVALSAGLHTLVRS
jgi:hypothetical protein